MRRWNLQTHFVQRTGLVSLLLMTLGLSQLFACAAEREESGSCPSGYARDGERVCRPHHLFDTDTEPGSFSDDAGDDVLEPIPNSQHADAREVLVDIVPTCLRFGGSVTITEIFANPEGPDGDFEFVELLISDDGEGDVWLEAFNANDDEPYWTMEIPIRSVPNDTSPQDSVTPRRFVVGREQLIDGAPLPCEAAGGCLQNGPDRLTVSTCDGELLDEVRYPALASGVSYAICEFPTQAEAGEYSLAEESAGGPADKFLTDSFCRAPCAPPLAFEARIEQIFVNPDGADAGYEFLAIRAEASVDTTELEVLGFDGNKESNWFGPQSFRDVDSSDGLLVLAGREVASNYPSLGTSLQNGPDGLRLISCGDVVIDEVTWGDAPSATISQPTIPLPLSDELWVRCGENEWWSLLIDKGSGPLDAIQLKAVCADAELMSEPMQ